jgi:hypothetical protein
MITYVWGLGTPIGSRVSTVQNLPTTPSPYAFLIWWPIFAGCLAYGIYQFLPSQRNNIAYRNVGFLTIITFFFSICWMSVAQFGSQSIQWTTLPIIIVMFVCQMVVFMRLLHLRKVLSIFEDIWIVTPLIMYAGWLSLAVFLNLHSVIAEYEYTTYGINTTAMSILILLFAGLISTMYTLIAKGLATYPLTIIWGLIAIVIENARGFKDPIVALVASIVALCVLIAWVHERNLASN